MTAAGPRSGPPSNPFVRILMRQQASAFEDLRGADVSATVPVSERLLNEVIKEALPESMPVRDLHVAPQAGDRFLVRGRVGSSSFIPPLKVTVLIDRQPDLPSSAILVLKLELGALGVLAGPALRFLDALPPGLHVDRNRLYVDIATLLDQRGMRPYLDYLEQLRVNTADGAVVVSFRARVR
jgi:hypothetical protein